MKVFNQKKGKLRPNTKRLQFDFHVDAVKKLDAMKDLTDASSRAEVIRNAVRLYEYIIRQTENGYDVEFTKKEKRFKLIPLF